MKTLFYGGLLFISAISSFAQTCTSSDPIKPSTPNQLPVFSSLQGTAVVDGQNWLTLPQADTFLNLFPPDAISCFPDLATAQSVLANHTVANLVADSASIINGAPPDLFTAQVVGSTLQFSRQIHSTSSGGGLGSFSPYAGVHVLASGGLNIAYNVYGNGTQTPSTQIFCHFVVRDRFMNLVQNGQSPVATTGAGVSGMFSITIPSDGAYHIEVGYAANAFSPGNLRADFIISSGGPITFLPIRLLYNDTGTIKALYPSGVPQGTIDVIAEALDQALALNTNGQPLHPGTTAGSSNVAYRLTPTTQLDVEFSQFAFEAPFKVDCAGDYEVHLNFAQRPHGSTEPFRRFSRTVWKTLELGTNVVKGAFDIKAMAITMDGVVSEQLEYDTDYVLESVTLERSCQTAEPGRAEYALRSVHVTFPFGGGLAGSPAGSLRLDASAFSSETYSPLALSVATPLTGETKVVRSLTDGSIRQVKAPQALADVVTLGQSSFEVRFYTPSQVGTPDAQTGIYAVSGTPYVVHKFENPDAGQSINVRLRMTETRGGNNKVTEFAYDAASTLWSLSTGDGLRRESEAITTVNGDIVKTRIVRDSASRVVSKVARTYHAFAWGEELIQEVVDPDGAALTTTYEFYNVSSGDPHYGRLRQRIDPNGNWERFTYAAGGRVLKTIRPFLNAPATTSNESLCRVTENNYDTITDADGDSLAEARTTTIERTLGQETGRRYRIEWSKTITLGTDVCKRITDIVCVASGAAWDASANLVMETLTISTGTFAGRDRRVLNPDGTVTLTTYALNGSNVLTTTTKAGQPNTAKDDVIDGRRTVTVTSAAGQVTSEQVFDISSTLSLSLWAVTQFDSLNRPTRLDFDDGTYTAKEYACCGLSSERDRSGLVTTYAYDALGRQETVTRLGITTKSIYDAASRVTSVVRIGTNSTEMVQETSHYDLAGRLTAHRDPLNRTTTIAEAIDSGVGARTLTLTVSAANATPVITNPSTTAVTVSTSASYQITAVGSPTSYAAAGLPSGLSVNTSNGLISGTTTATGNHSVTLSATNASGTTNKPLTLTVAAANATPIVTSADAALGTVGASFSYQIAATSTPTSYAATGLPAGLSVNPISGLMSGTALTAGTHTITLGATNGTGTGTRTLVLSISGAITSADAAWATNGSSFNYQIGANNSPSSYTATGLPAGLSVNSGNGLISGTPTANGTFTVTLTANNSSATGESTRTTTNPDGGTTIKVSARDGSRTSVSGTAAAPHAFEYGVDGTGVFTKDTLIGVDGSGQPTSTEWVKTYTDFAGRPLKTVFADNATQQSFYNTIGQLIREVDPDGVTTLFAYNARGERETVAVDLNANNTIDLAGTDRVSKTTRTVASKTEASVAYTVLRTTTQIWETDSQDTPVTVAIAEQSSNGLRSWQTNRGLTTKSVTAFDGSGGRTVTATTSDGAKTVQVYAGNRLSSTTLKTPADAQLAAVSHGYDPHGRLQTTTDARNGATTFTYHADDQLHTITTADPDTNQSGTGYDPQVTTNSYDSAGRLSTVTQPDGGVVNTTYWPTGATKRTWGSRTYPVEYTYDPQGRVKTLTTWHNFVGDSGKAATKWNYHAQRGWLENKRYHDNTGPAYTYKPSGRLHTRVWARTPTITKTYSYNAAGDLSGTDYSDSTPDVSITYDRSGRPKTMTDGSGARTLTYHASGQLEDETYTSGLLNGYTIDRSFDSMHRFSGVAALSSASATLSSATYAYDTSSRLETVTSGQNTATYGYLANSPLVEMVTFKNNGTTRMTTTKVYDKLNRLTSISSTPSAASAISYAYTYNAANQRTRVMHADNAHWNYGYDALGQVTSGKKFLAGAQAVPGHDYAWTFDDIGNRKTSTTNGAGATYTPNLLNQYSDRTVPGTIEVMGAANSSATVTVAINSGTPQSTTRQGDLFYKQLTVTNTSSPQNASLSITGVRNLVGPNQEDAVTTVSKSAFVGQTPETFTHDLDGNLTADARWSYTWDGENRLVALETKTAAVTAGAAKQKLEFAYDGTGRRFSKKVYVWNAGSGVWALNYELKFFYDSWNLLAEVGPTGSAIRSYAWGLDISGSLQGSGGVGGLLNIIDTGTSTTHVVAFDGNGNVGGLAKAMDGTLMARYDYNASGEALSVDGAFATANAIRFSTKYVDSETGHLYYGYRCYAPETGRWLSRDPLEENGGPNLGVFSSNDGINAIDPLGLIEEIGPGVYLLSSGYVVANSPTSRFAGSQGWILSGLSQAEVAALNFETAIEKGDCDRAKAYLRVLEPYLQYGIGGMSPSQTFGVILSGAKNPRQMAMFLAGFVTGTAMSGGGPTLLSVEGIRFVPTISADSRYFVRGSVAETPALMSTSEMLTNLKYYHIDLQLAGRSNRSLGPNLSIAQDLVSGRVSRVYGNERGYIPSDLNGLIASRMLDAPPYVKAPSGPGTHAEIFAANELLNARPGAKLSDLRVVNLDLTKTYFWQAKPSCVQCEHLLRGANINK